MLGTGSLAALDWAQARGRQSCSLVFVLFFPVQISTGARAIALVGCGRGPSVGLRRMVAVLFFSLVWVSLMWTARLQVRSAFEDFVLFCFVQKGWRGHGYAGRKAGSRNRRRFSTVLQTNVAHSCSAGGLRSVRGKVFNLIQSS